MAFALFLWAILIVLLIRDSYKKGKERKVIQVKMDAITLKQKQAQAFEDLEFVTKRLLGYNLDGKAYYYRKSRRNYSGHRGKMA